jgi:hypothetical protein
MATENSIGDFWTTKHQRIHNDLATILEDPHTYGCSVVAYTYHHHQLLIEVIDPTAKEYEPRCYIGFESAFYFEGPLSWHGVDFRLGSIAEREALLGEGWVNAGDALHEMAEHYLPLLLILERPTFRVRILAGACYVTETRPFEIHQVFPNSSQ